MAHGDYGRRRIEGRRPVDGHRRSRGLGPENKKGKKKKKAKSVSVKNQIRSTERMLRKVIPNSSIPFSKNLPPEIKDAQAKKLDELKRHQELQSRLATERKIHMRDKKIKFFERRKIERMIRRLEKQLRSSSDHILEEKLSDQLTKFREDLEYVRFFPKMEKYVSLFVGGDNLDVVNKRIKLREKIKSNLVAAAASGKDLEETGSDDDALDMSDDDFFLSGSSSDEAEADDEWTDKSTREPASSASGKAASSNFSDEKNQKELSARVLMPPPRALPSSRRGSTEKIEVSTSSNTSRSMSGPSFRSRGTSRSTSGPSFLSRGSLDSRTDHNSNLSSNSDAYKPRRKRRPKKKKQA